MVSFERARELLADLQLSDAEIEDARTLAWLFAGIVWEHRRASRPAPSKDNVQVSPSLPLNEPSASI